MLEVGNKKQPHQSNGYMALFHEMSISVYILKHGVDDEGSSS